MDKPVFVFHPTGESFIRHKAWPQATWQILTFTTCEFGEIVEQSTGWEPRNQSTSPGILAETLVAALLCGCRPIYKVERFWKNKGVEIFYEKDGLTAQQLNDDAYARMLDRLASIDCQRMFENVCLNMLQYHNLDICLTHSDTTSISVEGIYNVDENGDADSEDLTEKFQINHGHSKDLRPDLKQFKMGLSVQEDGLPLSGQILSGNKSDQVWNPEAVEELAALLTKRGYQNVVFLADCALISTQSLQNLAQRDIQFISRFPETFALAGELKREAWEKGNWEDIGALSEAKDASLYKAWRTEREVGGESFGFLVIHSSKLEERKEKTLEKSVGRTKKELETQSAELSRTAYACAADATREGEELKKQIEKKGFEVELNVTPKEVYKYKRRGRPGKGEEAEKSVEWYAELKVGGMKPEVYEEKKKRESTFVLVYRLKENRTAGEIVKDYKNQNRVEQGFRFMKQPQYLGEVYTKDPGRVKAMGYIFLLVLLLAKYLEYRVRIEMKRSGGELKVGGQKIPRPTAKTILEFLDEVSVFKMNGKLMLPDNLGRLLREECGKGKNQKR